MITQSRLKELLEYDPCTGVFTWLQHSNRKDLIGKCAGSKDPSGYIYLGIDGEYCAAHRLVFLYVEGTLPPDQVDHLNTIKDDNRWVNLRKCTRSENMSNPLTLAKNSTTHLGNRNAVGNTNAKGYKHTDLSRIRMSESHTLRCSNKLNAM
jgi:hypothetical protein